MQAGALATAAAIIVVVTACSVPTPEPSPLAPTSTPSTDPAALQADRLFATPQTCEQTLAGHSIEITFPGAWKTNAAVDGIRACTWFGPDLVTHSLLTEPTEGAAITVGSVGGPATFQHEWISREELSIAGRPAWRIEELVASASAAQETRELIYWVSLGVTAAGGPTLVARTATDAAGNYAINRAVLDRMMESLVVR